MTFLEKYKVLQDKTYLINMITESVYDTMHLEGQGVPKEIIRELVSQSLQAQKPDSKHN